MFKHKSNMSSNQATLGQKIYAVAMSVMMVASLWPSGASSALASAAQSIEPGTYGNYTYEQNSTTNAFTSSEYNAYRDPVATQWLGIAGSFHITAFNQVNIRSHVYGNILTKTLMGSNNFGPRSEYGTRYGYQTLSYIQSYPHPSSNPDGKSDGVFVIGSDNTVTAVDNNNHLAINDTKLDSPNTLIQDTNTEENPFIDLDEVYEYTSGVSDDLAKVKDVGATVTTENGITYINYEGTEGCAYVTMTADQLNNMNELRVRGMALDGKCSVVINVKMNGATQLNLSKIYVLNPDGSKAGTGETDSNVGYVLFNIVDSTSDMTISLSDQVLASVLAPNSTINLGGTAAGTYIAYNVNVTAESHARPFRGTLTPVTDSFSVNKVWLDAYGVAESDDVANAHGAVRVQLYQKSSADGSAWTAYGDPVELSSSNDWSYSWATLPKKDADGTTYTYKVAEVSTTDDYTDVTDYDSQAGKTSWTITNRHVAVGKLTINKVWDDSDDSDQIRPDSVTVKIVRSVNGGEKETYEEGIVLNADNNWTYSIDQLPLTDENGNEYTYEVTEDAVDGYTSDVTVSDPTTDSHGNKAWTYTVTNSHTPQRATTDVDVTKEWLAADGTAETGAHDPVTVQLYQSKNGETPSAYGDAVTLSSENSWSCKWSGLVSKDGYGNVYTYTVGETSGADGYTSSVTTSSTNSYKITNRRVAEGTITVSKKWEDDGDHDKIRPASVTVKITRSVEGGTAETVEDNIVLSSSNNWTYTKGGLALKDANGNAYKYEVSETSDAQGYTKQVTLSKTDTDDYGNTTWSYTVTNTHGSTYKTTELEVNKQWLNADGTTESGEHDPVTVQLYQKVNEGDWTAYGEAVTLSTDNSWSNKWANLIQVDAWGNSYQYEVRETEVPDGYTSNVTNSGTSWTISNKRVATVAVAAQKSWDDANNADGLRPGSVTVNVIQTTYDGATSKTVGTLELTEANGWKASMSGLPKTDAQGNEYSYALEEQKVEGYTGTVSDPTKTVSQSGNVTTWSFSLTNKHDQAKTSLSVTKTWADADNQDGIRPKKIDVTVYRAVKGEDGDLGEKQFVANLELNAENNWQASLAELPANVDGKEYVYSVSEDGVEGYTGEVVETTAEDGSHVFALTNTHEVAKTSVAVTKQWNDKDDFDQIRPSSVTVQLAIKDSDGTVTPVDGTKQTLSVENSWAATWSGLDANADGKAINYTVVECDLPDGYTPSISDGISTDDGETYTFTLTNSHTVDEMDFSLEGYSVASITEVLQPDDVCYVDPKIYKALDGRQLQDGEFTFELVNEATGEVVSTAKNDATGMVDFDAANNVSPDGMDACCLKFDHADTYTYVVREVSETKDSTVEYSDEVVKFVVEVTQGTDGKLVSDGGRYVYYKNASDTMGTVISDGTHPTITNTVKGIILGLTKTDESGEALAGATYGLYTTDENGDAVLVDTATSDADGSMVFGAVDEHDITEGTEYWFAEVEAPAGYARSYEQTVHFTVQHSEDGEGGYYLADMDGQALTDVVAGGLVLSFGSVKDEALSVALYKVDTEGAGIKGAELVVTEADGGEVVDSWTSDGTGHVLSGITAGTTYVLHEASVPDGYTRADDVEFVVDEAGRVSITSGTNAVKESKAVVNAYLGEGSISLIDYRKDEIVIPQEVKREEGIPSQNVPNTGDTTTSPVLLVVGGVAIVVLAVVLWRNNRKE